MRRSEREVYLELSRVPVLWLDGDKDLPGLCNLCRYADWSGGNCADPDLDCRHGLSVVAECAFEVWSGDDCWGFVPQSPLDAIVEWVSQRTQARGVRLPTRKEWQQATGGGQ